MNWEYRQDLHWAMTSIGKQINFGQNPKNTMVHELLNDISRQLIILRLQWGHDPFDDISC